ncbi:MAG: TIGR03768 family metallophosphoesterase [Candidatus Omnitrophica bacterium]|nr:TIGR03768 family metallophosphoesterase [Candidatus Omnitrophota bacterium]
MKRYYKHKKFYLTLFAYILFFALEGYAKSDIGGKSLPGEYPIDIDIFTTRDRTIVPGPKPSVPIHLSQVSKYKQYGYGLWHYGPGDELVRRLDIMSPAYNGAAVTRKTKLLNFFTISDIHISDKESPSQLIYLQHLHDTLPIGVSLYSGSMLYTTHVLDAVVRTINALNERTPFDFGISLGDTCNNTQYNELRWYIDVLDGKVITPSSGANLGADSIDYQRPYKAAGLDKAIPWYQALGNHDHFWVGSIPVNDLLRKSFISDTVMAAGDVLVDPRKINSPDYYMGVIDGSTSYGDIKYAGQAADFKTPPKVVPDPARRSLLRTEWMKEFFETSSSPAGHGFKMEDADKGFACYSFVPKATIPMKVIVLDDTQREDDGSFDIHGHGFLDKERWDWLKKELADGDAAGQLMIIAAHIPIDVEAAKSEMAWWNDPKNAVTLQELIAELQNHPNLIMWISGHRHLNTVKAFISPDPVNSPEKGFWQVETSSLRDFPQQFRTFEIYLNSDYTISIVTTDVDPAAKDGTPAATSRSYAIAAEQIVGDGIHAYNYNPTNDPTIKPMPNGAYNAELVKELSPKMQMKLTNKKLISNAVVRQ